jgi:two-component system cell cycle sensor histidine kinase PleC
LQPLGQERHRDPAPPRPVRQPRMRSSSPYGASTPYRAGA